MSDLLYEKNGAIATLTLNRPHRLNAISGPMLDAIAEKLVEADRDTDVRVIVLTGAGRGFCAGLDLKDSSSGQGIGGALLAQLRGQTDRPMLIGTWAAADWAVRFYEKHDFAVVTREEKDRLLRQYWNIPERQIETSVVLADARWRQRSSPIAG